MTFVEHAERRPACSETASASSTPTMSVSTAILPADSSPLLAVIVERELKNGNVRRTVVRSLATAERQVERALAAGCAASLQLVRLTPVDVVTPADLAQLEGGGCE